MRQQFVADTGYLRLYLAQLGNKLGPEPSRQRYLMTKPGMGDRFGPDEASARQLLMSAR